MIEQQTLLFEAAQRERASAMTEMKRIAQTLCKDAWDAKSRDGEKIEDWSPRQLANLIIQSASVLLRNTHLSQDPTLAEKHRRALDELADVKADNHRLRQRCRAAEDTVRDLRSAALRETAKQQKMVEKSSGIGPSREQLPPEENNRATPVEEESVPFVSYAYETSTASNNLAQSEQRDIHMETRRPSAPGSSNTRVDDVICIIARTGLCRWKDISKQLADLWGVRPSTGTIDTAIKKALELELLRIEEVRLEWGGKPTGKVLILTEEGKRCAVSLNVGPVESHYTRGLAVHKDGSHFYAIVEVASILAAHYSRVDFFPAGVSLSAGKYYPDVVAITADGERIYIEVERGTHKDKRDRGGKWLRAAAANKGTVYLVTPNLDVMTAIVTEICDIRDRLPGTIDRILAFNVRSHREQKDHQLDTLWNPEGKRNI